MKNYDETIISVFDRINAFEHKRKQRNKVITKTVVSICSSCLIILLGVSVWQNGQLMTPSPTILGTEPASSSTTMPANSEIPSNEIINIHLNHIDKIANSAPLYLDPSKHHKVEWSGAETAAYLGVDLCSLGNEFDYIGADSHSVMYRNDGTLVTDIIAFRYQYAGCEYSVAVSKLTTPYDCIYTLNQEQTTPVAAKDGSIDVLFAVSLSSENVGEELSLIVADFELDGLFYRVKAENVPLTNFYNLIKVIVNR